ncbi:hypothetical protein EVG18_01740 [Burkholderia pyrrocinia]|nr:hypothetical protein EVG18_01740 [Burkholderia pyrrocinia]
MAVAAARGVEPHERPRRDREVAQRNPAAAVADRQHVAGRRARRLDEYGRCAVCMRVVQQVRQDPVERRRRQPEARIGVEPRLDRRRVRRDRAIAACDPLARLVDRHRLAAIGPAVRKHQKLVDDVRHRVDVAHDAVAQARVVHHFRAQAHPRKRRAQVVRDARQHHRAVVVGLRHLLDHLVEAMRELAQLARAALAQWRHRLPAAEARDRARERAQRLLQLPGREQRGDHAGREDRAEP